MKKYSPGGCECCGCAVRQYPLVANWTTVGGGTVTQDGDSLDMSGEVNPSSFLTGKEAYQIKFNLIGKAEITIGSDVFTIDSVAQTIKIGTNTIAIGQASQAYAREVVDVEIRATPTHCYLLVHGNYQLPSTAYAYGILTVARTTNPPLSFTIQWTAATITGFQIADSEVEVEDATYYAPESHIKRCWLEPNAECPYYLIKSVTRNHEYQDDAIGDQMMPDVAFTGWDPSDEFPPTLSNPQPWVTGIVLACNLLTDETGNYQTMSLGDPSCSFSTLAKRWYEETIGYVTTNYCQVFDQIRLAFKPDRNVSLSGSFSIDFGVETQADAYPVPAFIVDFAVAFTTYIFICNGYYTSGGSVQSTLAVNSLAGGVTITIVGSESVTVPSCQDHISDFGVMGATWTI